ncbi:MAG: PIN-like domain-containing protein [Chloroflexota bacterium]
MKLFVDEDTGAGLGRALAAVGVQARYVAKDMPIVPGTKDEHWIPWAGREGSLVLSRNTAILEAEAQRSLLIVCGVGIVFLPQHLSSFSLLRLILKKWEWLETADTAVTRPFAFRMASSGRTSLLRFPRTAQQALDGAAASEDSDS